MQLSMEDKLDGLGLQPHILAVKAAERILEEGIARHRNDPLLTKEEEKEAEEAVDRLFAWWR